MWPPRSPRKGRSRRRMFSFSAQGVTSKRQGHQALQRVCKVDASKSKEQARAEGWLERFRGNDAADAPAKRIRPEPEVKTKVQ